MTCDEIYKTNKYFTQHQYKKNLCPKPLNNKTYFLNLNPKLSNVLLQLIFEIIKCFIYGMGFLFLRCLYIYIYGNMITKFVCLFIYL